MTTTTSTSDLDLPAVAKDFIRAANSKGLTVDIRPDEDGGVAIQIRNAAGTALDLFFFRAATTNRWRNGHFRAIRNAAEVPIATVPEAGRFLCLWL